MRENTPPRIPEIEEDEGEVINFENDVPPEDDDELEMEEVTLEELEARLGGGGENCDDDDDEGAEGEGSGAHSPVQDDAVLTFQRHSAPIFACALHPLNEWAATGGEDDRVYIWKRSSGEVIYEVTEHKDTVIEVHFNHDGTYLASGDMAGEIFVHKLQENANGGSAGGNGNGKEATVAITKVWEYSMGDMSWMRWHRSANVLMAGSENGEIYVWRVPAGDCKILPGQGVRCESGELSSDGKKLFAAYNDGTLKLWDIKSCNVLMEVDVHHPMVHQEGATTVACDKESPLYMSGGEDGKILFCTPNGPVGMVEASGPVECVAFSPSSDFRMAASGTLHGQIAIWDHSKHSMRTLCDHPEMDDGITRLQWISDFTLLVATIQGNIYGYDARSGVRKFSLSGHLADVYSFCYDPRESLLLSVSEDHSAKIFCVPQLGD